MNATRPARPRGLRRAIAALLLVAAACSSSVDPRQAPDAAPSPTLEPGASAAVRTARPPGAAVSSSPPTRRRDSVPLPANVARSVG